MAAQEHTRHVGDTEVALAVTLQRPAGTPVDLTSLTTKFKMLSSEGATVVAATTSNVTVTDSTAGECQYDFQAVDVAAAGRHFAYFITTDASSNIDTFPVVRADLTVIFEPDVQT